MRDIRRRSCASSSGVHDPKSRWRSTAVLAGGSADGCRLLVVRHDRRGPRRAGVAAARPPSASAASVTGSLRRSPCSTAGGRRGCSAAPRESATSTKPRKTSANTASNVASSVRSPATVTRASQYSSSVVLGAAMSSAAASRPARSGVTAMPARCRRSANRATRSATSGINRWRPSRTSGRRRARHRLGT